MEGLGLSGEDLSKGGGRYSGIGYVLLLCGKVVAVVCFRVVVHVRGYEKDDRGNISGR